MCKGERAQMERLIAAVDLVQRSIRCLYSVLCKYISKQLCILYVCNRHTHTHTHTS